MDASEDVPGPMAEYREDDDQAELAGGDREGEPCPAPGCRQTVQRIAQSGRSTFYCPACQR